MLKSTFKKAILFFLYLVKIDKIFYRVQQIVITVEVKRLSQTFRTHINFCMQGDGGLKIECAKKDKENYFQIHETSHLKSGTYIECSGGVSIGEYFHTGRNLTILSTNHNYRSGDYIPYGLIDIERKVVIDGFVWCGANVTILPGVHIGEGAIIGAGTVVSKNVPPGAIVVGNPGAIVKFRDKEVFNKLKLEGKYI